MKKFLARHFLVIALLAILPAMVLTESGCAYFKSQTTQAKVFYTFKDSWALAHTAYQGWSERVVLGKVTQEKSDKVDAAWNKYRAAFKTSFALATSNWSAITPASLAAAQAELISLITTLSQ